MTQNRESSQAANGTMSDHFPDDACLIELAGTAAFERGRAYHAAGRVALSLVAEAALAGEAHGTETYRLRLAHDGSDWLWDCDCPAAADGAFCKHLVAAVLTARDEAEDGDGTAAPKKKPASASVRKGELLAFLHAQPAARLAGWLHALAQEDGNVEKRLLLYRAAEQPEALKAALAKLLNAGGFLDYRRAIDYARRLGAAIELLQDMLSRDPDECRVLCEYALGRLFKVYGNSDDSAGAIGGVMEALAELYAQACAATQPCKGLAKTLHALQGKDGWGVLSLAGYWKALGAQGQAEYGRLVVAEFEKLPAPKAGEHFGEGFEVCRRTEELARCAGDFELLQRVLRRDLSQAYQYFRVLESLREFGRAREALAWAETAVKRFPDDGRLRALLSECLAEAGMNDEALEQAWLRFHRHPGDDEWDALKRMAGKTWPHWRQRALDDVAAYERGHATVRIDLLLHDGDVAAATSLAHDHAVMPQVLHVLAQRLRRSDPATAGAFYLRLARQQAEKLGYANEYPRLVAYLKDASKLLPATQWQPFLATVRAQHARKTKLMGLLAQAGL